MLRAALKGHVDAMEQVAYDYMNGIGVEKDLVIGFEWMQAAAEAGQVDAMENVAINKYLDGNYWDAYKWFSKAAAKGSKTAAEWLKDLDEYLDEDQNTTR
jgi:TPR repeat protein